MLGSLHATGSTSINNATGTNNRQRIISVGSGRLAMVLRPARVASCGSDAAADRRQAGVRSQVVLRWIGDFPPFNPWRGLVVVGWAIPYSLLRAYFVSLSLLQKLCHLGFMKGISGSCCDVGTCRFFCVFVTTMNACSYVIGMACAYFNHRQLMSRM